MREIKLSLEKQVIESQIEATLKEMATIYQMEERIDRLKAEASQGWSDGQSIMGLINSCEALECFFIPYLSISSLRKKFWSGELIDLSIIRDTLKYIMSGYKGAPAVSGSFGLSGTPYIDFTLKGSEANKEKSGIAKNFDFLDSAAFILSALLDARVIDFDQKRLLSEGVLSVEQPPLIPTDFEDEWVSRVTNAFRVLKECDTGEGGGFTYTNDDSENNRKDYLYFTWNALETFDVLKEYDQSCPNIFPASIKENILEEDITSYINSLFIDKRSWLTSRFLSKEDNSDLYIPENVVKFGQRGKESIYYNLFALISLLIVGSKDTELIRSALKNVIVTYSSNKDNLQREIKAKNYGEFKLEGALCEKHEKYWPERAFYPLLIKAIALFIGKCKGDETNLIRLIADDESGFDSLPSVVNYFLNLIQTCKCVHLRDREITNVWDNLITSEYSIYYTERAVEALCALYRCYYPNDSTPPLILKGIQQETHVAETPLAPQTRGMGVSIHIDGEVISQTLKEKITGEIEDELRKVAETIKNELTSHIQEATQKAIDNKIGEFVDDHIEKTFEYIRNNINAKNPEKKYKDLSRKFSEISGQCLSEILYEALKSANEKATKKLDRNDFKERINVLLSFLSNIETERLPDESLDYSDLLGKLQREQFLNYMKKVKKIS